MLLPANPPQVFAYPVQQAPEREYISLRDVIDFLWQNVVLIAACIVALTALGAAYAFTTPPTYTAEARLIIDASQSRMVLQEPDSYSLAMESARVDSEVELVKSRSIALAVIERLNLVEEAEYNEEPGFVTKARRWVKAAFEDTPSMESNEVDSRLRRAMGAYAARLGVRRLGQSYVLEISYSSRSAVRAAEITNAIVDAYIEAKVESKAEGARRGAAWLEGRLDELGRQANRAAASVEQFKASQRIVKSTADGSLAERQLRDTSVQLLQARGEATRLKARLDAVDAMLAAGELNDIAAADVGENTILTSLRQRMIEAKVRQADVVSRYGTTGPVPAAADAEIEQIRAEIRAELSRVRAVYQVNFDAAEINQSSTVGTFDGMLDSAAETSGQYVRLAELESQASTYRRMYETLLQHFTQTVQRESFPVAEARVVTPAVQPFTPSQPKTALIVGLSFVLGSVLGVGAAVGRRALAKGISSAREVEARIGVPCLATLPKQGRAARFRSWFLGNAKLAPAELRTVLTAPHSDFSRALTSAKVSLDIALHQKRPLILGVTSVAGNARRSRIASNLAFLYAAEGASTLLIDADGQRLTLTAGFDPGANGAASPRRETGEEGEKKRAIDTFAGRVKRDQSIVGLEEGLHFASIADAGEAAPHRSLMSLRHCLSEVTRHYDVVVLDLPAMQEASDARALSQVLDGILIACEHLRTPLGDIAAAVASFGSAGNRFRGVIIDGGPKGASHG